jgi:hypothetical protein
VVIQNDLPLDDLRLNQAQHSCRVQALIGKLKGASTDDTVHSE